MSDRDDIIVEREFIAPRDVCPGQFVFIEQYNLVGLSWHFAKKGERMPLLVWLPVVGVVVKDIDDNLLYMPK